MTQPTYGCYLSNFMQKKYNLSFIIVSIALTFALLFVIAYHYVRQDPTKQETPPPALHPVLVVDFNEDNKLSEQELKLSQDAILAIRAPGKPDGGDEEVFNSLDALQRLDINKDKRIDSQDPMFPRLQLMFFTQDGKGRKYISLKDAGITTIVLTPAAVKPVEQKLGDQTYTIVGYAIKINGHKVQIRLVPISFV